MATDAPRKTPRHPCSARLATLAAASIALTIGAVQAQTQAQAPVLAAMQTHVVAAVQGPTQDGGEVLMALYARYLARGRGVSEIHLSADGAMASARIAPSGDGVFQCHVGGVRAINGTAVDADAMRRMVSVLIHEVTHCLVTPFLPELPDLNADADADAGTAAQRAQAARSLIVAVAESVSDARVIIEVHRVDGLHAARAMAVQMLPMRRVAADAGHRTAPAIEAALAAVERGDAMLQTDANAFALACRIGLQSAWPLIAEHESPPSANAGRELQALRDALAQAMVHAQASFLNGPLANDAATLKARFDRVSSNDWHFHVLADGRINRRSVYGAEGAHTAEAMAQALAESRPAAWPGAKEVNPAPEARAALPAASADQRLALQWLRRGGSPDAHTLPRARGAFSQLLRSFGDGTSATDERMVAVIAQTIARAPRDIELNQLLDDAAGELQALQRSGG